MTSLRLAVRANLKGGGLTMHWGALGLAATLLVAGCGPLVETKAEAEPQCFFVVAPTANTLPPIPILLNKCTGETWIVIRQLIKNADPAKGEKEEWAWRWAPLQKNFDEGQFQSSGN
jgi:hypothetical protein